MKYYSIKLDKPWQVGNVAYPRFKVVSAIWDVAIKSLSITGEYGYYIPDYKHYPQKLSNMWQSSPYGTLRLTLNGEDYDAVFSENGHSEELIHRWIVDKKHIEGTVVTDTEDPDLSET